MGTLTQYQKQQLPLLLVKGHTIREVAEMYGVSVSTVSTYVRVQLERSLNVPLYFNSKRVAYYNNEDDYGIIPGYKWSDISDEEKQILNRPEPDV